MFRIVTITLFLAFFLFCHLGYAEDIVYRYYTPIEYFSPEEYLYVLDEGKHFPNEFKPLLAKVCFDHPQYNKLDVMNSMISAYQAVQKTQPDISMYEVAKGVGRFSDAVLGIALETYVTAYVRSQVR